MKKQIFSMLLCMAMMFTLIPTAFAAEGGQPIRVAVIDTGISTAAIPNENLTEGHNYIRPLDGTEDKLGHGTAVAGLIVGNEALGVEGVCPEAVLVPLVYATKDENGETVRGKTDMAAQAICDAIDLYDCDIINLSSGGTSDSDALRLATDYAESRGVLVVSAAGNDNETAPEAVYYPGAYDSVLCVGSADGDAPAAFSQRNDAVDLLVPGVGLRVLTIRGTRIRGSGTSYSAAIVSGAAARLLSADPTLTAEELRELLMGTAQDIGPVGYDIDSGWGILNLDTALKRLNGAEEETVPVFSDVPANAWFSDGVTYAAENGLFNGTGADTFSPKADMTRQQMWMVLARVNGKAPANMAEAAKWATDNGVSDGSNPTNAVTREQFVTLLWRSAGSPAASKDMSGYTDFGSVADYAKESMRWAAENGIMAGTSGTTLSPENTATRAQIAVLLMRYLSM